MTHPIAYHKASLEDIGSILLGNLFITGAYAFITVPHAIINGGVTSFSLVLQNLIQIDVGIITNVITLLLLVLCYLGLGKEYFYKSILSSLCYMGFFNLFHSWNISLQLPDLICLPIASLMVGIGYYLCLRAKSSTVGFDVLALVLHRRDESISIAKTMRLINVAVILCGLISYGWLSIMMGIIFTLIQTKVLDLLLNKNTNPKQCKKLLMRKEKS